jgi:DNA ligase (NAD+)
MVGDTVWVTKGGEVIPKVTGVVTGERPSDARPVPVPVACPSCGTNVVREVGEVALRCPNPRCPAVVAARLRHFTSRGAMEIEGLGGKKLDQLIEAGLVTDEASLWDLDVETLVELPRWQTRSAENLVAELEGARSRPLHRVLFGLGVPGVGERVARQLAERFPSFDALTTATPEEMEAIDGIGPSLSASVARWFADDDNRALLARLRSRGVDPVATPGSAEGPLPLDGTVFVITGSLSRSRRETKERLEALGAKVVGSVSGTTTHLLAGEGGGSKLSKARDAGAAIVDEDGLGRLLDEMGGEELWPK